MVPDVTLENDDDVQFVSEFHPQKISTQSQRRFLPYKPVRSTGTLVKTETEPQTVAEIIRSQALSQRTQISPSIKNEPDVQFSFEFQPQKMSTQIQKVFFKSVKVSLIYILAQSKNGSAIIPATTEDYMQIRDSNGTRTVR